MTSNIVYINAKKWMKSFRDIGMLEGIYHVPFHISLNISLQMPWIMLLKNLMRKALALRFLPTEG